MALRFVLSKNQFQDAGKCSLLTQQQERPCDLLHFCYLENWGMREGGAFRMPENIQISWCELAERGLGLAMGAE